MHSKEVTLNIPENLCVELEKLAEASPLSFEQVVIQTIRSGMPPSLGKVPAEFHDELLALNSMNDRDLMEIVEGGKLDSVPQGEKYQKADFIALRRTYALSLLRWRGHPIPTPYEALID